MAQETLLRPGKNIERTMAAWVFPAERPVLARQLASAGSPRSLSITRLPSRSLRLPSHAPCALVLRAVPTHQQAEGG